MTLWQAQSVFSKGELDPLLLGRTDLEAYYQGAQEATNMLSIPQGGMKKRPGTKYVATALGNGRLENFSFNVQQNYLLVFTSGQFQVFKDGVLQTTVATPYTSLDTIREFDYIQSADTVIITHEDYAPRIIQRTSDVAWTIGLAPLTNIPQYDFNDASSPAPVSEIQTIKFTNANDGDRFKLSLEGILTEEIVLNRANTATTKQNIAQALLELPILGNSGVTVAFQSASPDVYRITFSGESANNWDEISGTPIFTKNSSFEVITSTIANGTSHF